MDAITARAWQLLILTLTVPLFLLIGYRLFVLGATGKMKVSGDLDGHATVSISDLAPGSFCFLLGVALSAFLIRDRLIMAPVTVSCPAATAAGPNSNTDANQSNIAPPGPVSGATPTPSNPHRTIAENTPPPSPHSITVPQGTNSLMSSWLYGIPNTLPLSVRLSRAIEDMNSCKQSPPSNTNCELFFWGKFHKLPTPSDLAHIHQLEIEARTSQGAANELVQLDTYYE